MRGWLVGTLGYQSAVCVVSGLECCVLRGRVLKPSGGESGECRDESGKAEFRSQDSGF